MKKNQSIKFKLLVMTLASLAFLISSVTLANKIDRYRKVKYEYLADTTLEEKKQIFIDYANNLDLGFDLIVIDEEYPIIDGYKEEEFLRENRTVNFLTPNNCFQIEVIGGIIVPDAFNISSGNFKNNDEKEIYLRFILNETGNLNEVEIKEDDKIIALSMTSYEYEGAKYILFGKLGGNIDDNF